MGRRINCRGIRTRNSWSGVDSLTNTVVGTSCYDECRYFLFHLVS